MRLTYEFRGCNEVINVGVRLERCVQLTEPRYFDGGSMLLSQRVVTLLFQVFEKSCFNFLNENIN